MVMLKRQITIIVIAGGLVAGCSDPDPANLHLQPKPDVPPASIPPVDVSGTWFARIEQNAVNCDAGEYIDAKTFLISQDDRDITILTSTGDQYAGTVNGDIVEWFGSYDERGGTANYTSATMVFSADAGSGDAAWTWSNGTDSCNGTTKITLGKSYFGETNNNSNPSIADPFDFVDSVAFFEASLNSDRDWNDYFTFTATSDGVLQVEASHFDTSVADIDLALHTDTTVDVAASRTSDQFEMVQAPVQMGETYYIHVHGITLPGRIGYNLSIDIN